MSSSKAALFLCLVMASVPASGQVSRNATSLNLRLAPLPALDEDMRKVGADLAQLHQDFLEHQRRADGTPFRVSASWLPVRGDFVVIDAVAEGDAASLLGELEALGLEAGGSYGRVVSGLFPVGQIRRMATLDALRFARPAYSSASVGLTTSQGDQAIRSDDARATFGVDGSGVVVGVLSGSFDCATAPATNAAADVASGDLPPGIVVLDDSACPDIDEGRAMMQVVADVAPGAGQAFHTANTGQANFANGILELASVAGADVVVDDILYFAEPMFQDGIIAQAVDTVVATGVPYFSSAGNSARLAYESGFRDSGYHPFGTTEVAHDFDPGAGLDPFQQVTLPSGTTYFTLQWDSPYFSVSGSPGSSNDLQIYLLDDPVSTILGGSANPNVGGDPVELLIVTNPGSPINVNLMITRAAGPDPGRMKYVIPNSDATINQFATNSSTLYGHANAAGAEAIGAAAYFNTPEFGVDPALLNFFSSAGPTPILFDPAGNSVLDVRAKPELVCADGGNNTFFGADSAADVDTFPNFFGTSAAAPHAAAVAALMLQVNPKLTPSEIYSKLETTADDMGPAGFDDDTGFGFCQADLAVALVCGESLALTPGQWKLFSLACDVGAANQVSDLVGDDLTGTYNVDWAVFKRDEVNQQYVLLDPADPLVEGRGYWIITLNSGQSFRVEGGPNDVIDVPLVSDPSSGRLNMLGTPFRFDVCWADVEVIDGGTPLSLAEADPMVGSVRACSLVPPDPSCVLSRTVYTWNGGAYEAFDGETVGAEGTLHPFDGFWVKAFKNGISLRVPALPSSSCGAGPPPPPPPFAAGPAPWAVRLTVESDTLRDPGNLLGQLPDSVQGFDSHDLPELPPFGDSFLTLVFPHGDWGAQAGDYTTDFHAVGSRTDDWQMEVRSSEVGKEITLRWGGWPSSQSRAQAWLIDDETGEVVAAVPGGSYTFRMTSGRRPLRWHVGSKPAP